MLHAHTYQYGFGQFRRLLGVHPFYQSGHHSVFEGVKFRQQMMKLKYKTNGLIAERSESLIIITKNALAFEKNISTVRPFQGPQHMQKG